MCSFDILELNPLAHEQGYNPQAQGCYLARTKSLGLSVPDEVLLDWFQQNPGIAGEWAFLDLPALTWRQVSYTPGALPGAAVMRGGASQLNRLMREAPIIRQLIYKQVETNLAWTTPPILLHTASRPFLTEPPEWLQSPLHLVEGYHRLASLHAIKGRLDPAGDHWFWEAT